MLRIKIEGLQFGAPITLMEDRPMEVKRECVNQDENIWKTEIRSLQENDESTVFKGEREGSLSSLIPDERRYLYRVFDESVGEAAEEGLEPQADD